MVKYNCCKGESFKLAMQNPVNRLVPVRNNTYPSIMSFVSGIEAGNCSIVGLTSAKTPSQKPTALHE